MAEGFSVAISPVFPVWLHLGLKVYRSTETVKVLGDKPTPWNGSSLEKAWQTEEVENYLADYVVDPSGNELVNLEIVKHPGMFGKGASVVSVRKIR